MPSAFTIINLFVMLCLSFLIFKIADIKDTLKIGGWALNAMKKDNATLVSTGNPILMLKLMEKFKINILNLKYLAADRHQWPEVFS
jgi:hypothetical protein